MPKTEDIQLNLKPFDIHKINKASIVVFIGRRGSGKSIGIKDLLFHNKDIPLGLVMSHTDHLSHFYDQFIPEMLIKKRFDTIQMKKLFDRQKKALDENWQTPDAFIVLDDVLADKSWKKDENVQELFFNGRHYKLLAVIGLQTAMGIPPELRQQVDYTFIFKSNNFNERKKIYENYAGSIKSFEIFNIILDATTEDHHCLVIDNKTLSNHMEDQIFYYKAKMHDKFRICSNDIWQINDKKKFQQESIKYNNTYTKIEKPISKGKGKMVINKKLAK